MLVIASNIIVLVGDSFEHLYSIFIFDAIAWLVLKTIVKCSSSRFQMHQRLNLDEEEEEEDFRPFSSVFGF
jgi:hypothetical protein